MALFTRRFGFGFGFARSSVLPADGFATFGLTDVLFRRRFRGAFGSSVLDRSSGFGIRFGCVLLRCFGSFGRFGFALGCLSRSRGAGGFDRFEVRGDGLVNLLHHFFADARNFDQLLGRHIRELFHGRDAGSFELFDRLRSNAFQFSERRAGCRERGHLCFDFAAFFFLALDVDVPANQLAGEADVLAFFADGERKLRVLDNHFQALFLGIDDLDACDLRGAEPFLSEANRVLVVRDDVDFFAAQFANDRLHAHALHPHAGANGVNVLVAALDRDFRALAGFARYSANLHGAVVNFRHFHFKEPLHQGRIGARNNHLRAFCGALDGANGHAEAVAHVVRLEPRLFALRQARFRAAHVHDDVRALGALDDSVDELADARVELVVDGVALGLAYFLEDHLLSGLCRDAAEHIRRLGFCDLAAYFDGGILLARVRERNLAQRISDFLDHRVDRKHVHLAGFRIELRAELFLGAIVFPRRDHHRVLNVRDDDVRFDVFLPADLLDCLEQQTRHPLSPIAPSCGRLPAPLLQFNDQVRLANVREGHRDFVILQRHLHGTIRIAGEPPLEKLLLLHGLVQPNLGAPPDKSLVVGRLQQLPVKAGRADLEYIPGSRNQVVHVQDHAELLADALAVLVTDPRAFGVLGAGRPVDINPQKPLLADLPLDVKDFQALRASHALGGGAYLFQVHRLETARRPF